MHPAKKKYRQRHTSLSEQRANLIIRVYSKTQIENRTELALLPAGQWQADVPLTQQAGTPLKLDDFPVVYNQGTG
jgi:hypothetical protein